MTVEGPLGKLSFTHRPEIRVSVDSEKGVIFEREGNEKQARAYHGLTRALVQNMVIGCHQRLRKKNWRLSGSATWRAYRDKRFNSASALRNEVHKQIPQGLDVICPDQTHVVIKGSDKQMVGQFAAEVRAVRKPEPYKGKGIRYVDEYVRRKAGKAVGAVKQTTGRGQRQVKNKER